MKNIKIRLIAAATAVVSLAGTSAATVVTAGAESVRNAGYMMFRIQSSKSVDSAKWNNYHSLIVERALEDEVKARMTEEFGSFDKRSSEHYIRRAYIEEKLLKECGVIYAG